VVVVGQGATVGKPIALALMGEEATVRTCNKYTADLPAHTRDADVVIAAAGVPGLLGKDHIRPGAVVIDVGINSVPDPKDPSKSIVVGDVRTQEVAEVAGILTPVPGGVGPVTVAMLLRSTAEAAARQWGFRRIQ
jgi:methylenetetrahydrofolate dehydrogenase (NADP+)/methenyltetrahydrofolate cyclohydrolase